MSILKGILKTSPLGILVPSIIFLASVPPKVATSNIAGWAQDVGMRDFPKWTLTKFADRWILLACLILCVSYVVFVWAIPRLGVNMGEKARRLRARIVAGFGPTPNTSVAASPSVEACSADQNTTEPQLGLPRIGVFNAGHHNSFISCDVDGALVDTGHSNQYAYSRFTASHQETPDSKKNK